MRLVLVDDRKLKTIIRNQEDLKDIMARTLEGIEAILNTVEANLTEASTELGTYVAEVKEFIGAGDPARALAKLEKIAEISQRLADIVPNE
jgi:hypothetical protein